MMPIQPDYRAHAQFVAPAKERSEVWRLIFGLIMVIVALVLMGPTLAGVLIAIAQIFGVEMGNVDVSEGAHPASVLVTLMAYGLIIPAVLGVIWVLHNRPPLSVFGPPKALIAHAIVVVLSLVVLNVVIEILPPWGYGVDLIPNLALGAWVALLPLSLLAILIQTGAEEVLFRGYMQQQLGARFRSPLVWMMVPSLLFGLLHYDAASQGANAWYITIWAVLFGMAAADLTARSGSLGPAIALHFVNNVLALLIVTLPDSWHGLALYVTPFGSDDIEQTRPWLWVDLAFLGVSWLCARLAIQR